MSASTLFPEAPCSFTIEHLNKIIVFSPERAVLEHIKEWARILDDRRQESIEEAWFTYEVRNAQAAELTAILNAIIGGSTRGGSGARQPGACISRRASGRPARASGAQTSVTIAGGLVVDENRNLILFRGSGRDWAEILEVIQVLDKPVPSVLVEVVMAEVTLSER